MKCSLHSVKVGMREPYINALLIADESEKIVRTYYNEGELYAIRTEEALIGVALLIAQDAETIELKNIAIIPALQGQGFGKDALLQVIKLYENRNYKKMLVGTANSSIDNIAFYQKLGFRMTEIRQNFFLQYPEPIFENGIQALDMILFELTL